jgi:hypothetical protein
MAKEPRYLQFSTLIDVFLPETPIGGLATNGVPAELSNLAPKFVLNIARKYDQIVTGACHTDV